MNLALLACVSVLSCATRPSADDPAAALRAADRAFFQATRERGLEGWLAWFAADAVVFPPEGALAVGSADIRRHYAAQSGFPARGFVWEPETALLSAAGDFGWTIGRWGNDASGTPSWSGRYLTVWRKDPGGAWKVVADCGYDPQFAARLPGLAAAPSALGRGREHEFHSAGGECGGKFLSVWRRNADGTHELVTETGLLQAKR